MSIFPLEDYSTEGLYGVNFYINGLKKTIHIDDYFLKNADGSNVFAKVSDDGGFWVSAIEKAAAKLFGNHEYIQSGNLIDGTFWLTGFPGFSSYMSELSLTDLREILFWALDLHDFVVMGGSAGDSDTTTDDMGIVQAHAYSVLSITPVYDQTGNYVTDLLHMRNPWGSELYTGPWSDDSTLWTDYLKS
jgi:hypothetical protein